MKNLMAPEPTTLSEDHPDVAARIAIEQGVDPRDLVVKNPEGSAAWAALAREALAEADNVTAYAFARTGYHRGLDTLRKNGWRGTGPVPWSHAPNRGVLEAIASLALAAQAIGEFHEFNRCKDLIEDCDPAALAATGL